MGSVVERAEAAWQRLAGLDPFPQPPVIGIRRPVLLMHGFGLLASLRRGGHLHQEAMNLRAHGVMAYAPNVVPYSPTRVRAELWRSRIAHVLKETGARKINVIAQSMGGLDARYLISREGMHEVVASLVTVSTPHRGSSLADFVLEQPEGTQRRLAEVFNWMGSTAMEEASADFLAAVAELTPNYMQETFNRDVPDHPSVRYYSYAGSAGKGTNVPINPALQALNRLLYAREGLNDGFVAVESAKWGEFLGTIDADHASEVGITLLNNGQFDASGFYCAVVERLAADGF
jgi:triacylglycerol lipase